jgi:hypothetical protein
MRILHTCWLGGAVAGAVVGGAIYFACANWSQPDWVGVPAEGERLDRLEADRERLEHRREVIRALATALAEGRLSLREAAAALRAENLSSPPHLAMHVEYLPGATEEERYCRAMLRHVRAQLEGDGRLPALLARLESEAEALARGRPLGTTPPELPRSGLDVG